MKGGDQPRVQVQRGVQTGRTKLKYSGCLILKTIKAKYFGDENIASRGAA